MRSLASLFSTALLASCTLANNDAHLIDEHDSTDGLPDKCYGIALSDASDFGPYQAGALISLLKHQQLTGERYHVVTGVALGAINAYILATHTKDDIYGAINMLESFWLELAAGEAYQMWAGGFIYGFFFEKGIYDSEPMT
jgi:predicted acylesterase/phospholipase RssA